MSKVKIFMPCNEANHVCDKTQYKESTLWEKIILNLHLIYCSACRKYSSNNGKLTKLLKDSKIDCLDDKSKEAMKKEFEKALAKNQPE